EWPSRPRWCVTSTPPRISFLPAAKAWASNPSPTRFCNVQTSLVQQGFRQDEVAGVGYLQVGQLPLHHPHAIAVSFQQRCVVRRPYPLPVGALVGIEQGLGTETLRGLHRPQALPVGSPYHPAPLD